MWTHRLPVHIVPAEQTDLSEVYGKFAIFFGPMWASAPTRTVHVSYCFTKIGLFLQTEPRCIGLQRGSQRVEKVFC